MAGKKVLVIDDDPGIVRLDEKLLTSSGYEVISASSGAEGLKMAREQMPDAILLDLILPEMHGFEVCQRLKEDQQTEKIAVIVVTGSDLGEIAVNEPDVRADGYIAKPYNVKDLIEAIEQAIARTNP